MVNPPGVYSADGNPGPRVTWSPNSNWAHQLCSPEPWRSPAGARVQRLTASGHAWPSDDCTWRRSHWPDTRRNAECACLGCFSAIRDGDDPRVRVLLPVGLLLTSGNGEVALSGLLVQAPGVLGLVWAGGPQGRELRFSCRGQLHLGQRTRCLADPGSHVSRRSRPCSADWGGSGVLGRRWTLGSSCSGCSDSFSVLALQRDTKGGHSWKARLPVVVDGQQWAVSGQEGWSHEEKLALRSVL